MKLALIGATGFIGSGVLAEALARGHEVTAIVRNPRKLTPSLNLSPVEGDVEQMEKLATLLAGHKLVISAYNPGNDATGAGTRSMVEAVRSSGVQRLLVVGGAGSLEVAPGKRLVDQPDFPTEWKEGALRTAAFLDLLRKERELDWVFFSPAAVVAPGERTGRFRLGGDQFFTDSEGQSRISIQDFAVAMLDEAEKPRHSRTRISVAY